MEELKTYQRQEQLYSAKSDSFSECLHKIWRYRALIIAFARRDLKVKYAQTLIGLGWTLVQPLTALLIYSFFFGYLLQWNESGIPYPIYVLSGLLGWNLFSYGVNAGTSGLRESATIIRKIYFPKSIIPLSKLLVALIELAISFLLLIPLLYYFGQGVDRNIVFLPLVILFNCICSLTVVFWISAFAYRKQDLLHLIPFLLYFGIWFSPVFFSSNLLPERFSFLLDFNPMANVVQAWRWCLFGFGEFKSIWIGNFTLVSILLLLGLKLFNKKESQFSDFL